MSADPITWTSQVRTIRGSKFGFEGREYLVSMYRDPSPEIYIVKGRQTEMTEFSINWLLYHLLKNPFTIGLYMSDKMERVSTFSKLRLKDWAISKSPILSQLAQDSKGNVSWQPFKNGSHLYMHSGWDEFDLARSHPADFAVVDEAQNQDLAAIGVIRETMSHSKFRRILVLGTGSLEDDEWYKLWHQGDQKQWDARSKSWIAKRPENYPVASTYHLSQEIVPWISPDEIEDKRKRYTPRVFTTEVIGWYYKGQAKPLTERLMRFLFDKTQRLLAPEEVDHSKGPLYMGIDWGGGTKAFTIPWIWQLVDPKVPRFRLVYVDKVDEKSTEKQADRMIKLATDYRIKQGVMDGGGGTRQVEKMSNHFGNRFLSNFYSESPQDPTHYQPEVNMVTSDRTWVIETVIDLISRPEPHPAIPNGIPRIIVPNADPMKVEWIIENFTCIEAESYKTRGGMEYVRYTHPADQPDDALHSCNYAYLAYLYDKQGGSGTIVSTKAPGGSNYGSKGDDRSFLWQG